jgi:hypothetical protein
MKYAVFAGDIYYPCGGFNDLRGRFETLEEAREYATTNVNYGSHYEWYHIVDTATFTLVARG